MITVSAAGVDIPAIGLGTYQLTGEAGAQLVARAVHAGYRHVDTATVYGNEREVGEGLRHSGPAREQVFVTTKVWRDDLADGALQRSAEASLKRLGLDRLDLLLVHWPNPAVPLAETLAALAEVKRRGLTRAIGVSNFPAALLQEAAALCPEPLATNQIEHHPYLAQRRVLETALHLGVAVTAYSPLAQGLVLADPVLQTIAAEKGVSVPQVVIRWIVQQGAVAIPKSSSVERAATNLDVFGFELTDDEMQVIFGLARPDGRQTDPPWAPAWDSD